MASVPDMECKIPTRIGASSGREQAVSVPATSRQASRREEFDMGRSAARLDQTILAAFRPCGQTVPPPVAEAHQGLRAVRHGSDKPLPRDFPPVKIVKPVLPKIGLREGADGLAPELGRVFRPGDLFDLP